MRDEDGLIIERYSALGFAIGWDPPERVAVYGYPEIEILGQKVLVQPDTLDMLKGKELVLATVEVGYPNPASKTRRVLTCR